MSNDTAPESAERAADLLPCPFCGGTDVHLHDNGYKTYWVSCAGCGAAFDGSDIAGPAEAAAQWNRRAALAAAAVPEPTRVLQIGDESTPANRLATLLAGAGLINSPAMDDLAALVLAAPAPVVGAAPAAEPAAMFIRYRNQDANFAFGPWRSTDPITWYSFEQEAKLLAGYPADEKHVVRLYAAAAPQPPAQARTLLEQYDLDQSPDYRKGYEDGRLKGYEVGHRHATDALTSRAPAAPAEPVAYRYKDSRGHWRYVGAPLSPGWSMPPNLCHEPMYVTPAAPAEAVAVEAGGLPPLPKPIACRGDGVNTWDKFNAAQMHAYARAAMRASGVGGGAITAREVARQVFALCEATEDMPASAADDHGLERFRAGQRFEAKRIRRGIGTWLTDEENIRADRARAGKGE